MVGNIAVGSLLAADTVDAAAAVGLAVAAAVPDRRKRAAAAAAVVELHPAVHRTSKPVRRPR